MSENFKVPYTEILEILPHPNADRLEIAKVYGFFVVVQKDKYKVGDGVVYIPIDSILPQDLEARIFPKDSKITLNKSRVRQIKIRSFYSQGMIIDPKDLYSLGWEYENSLEFSSFETDLSLTLNITKYEPPTPEFQKATGPKQRNRPYSNPAFRAYNGITNVKWNPYAFKDGEEVVIQSKLHGSHIRFGKAPFSANTVWKKILKFLNLAPKFENNYGSNNVELTNRSRQKSFYGSDIYAAVLKKFDAFNKIKDGEFVHAELIGPGIQKGYTYGHKEHHLVMFDVRVLLEDGTQKWLNPEECEAFAKERGFDFVPVLYKGGYSKEIVDFHTTDIEIYYPKEIREGVVIKSRYSYDENQSKRAYKSINPAYLAGDQTDFH